jgi:hypothetical protein
MSRVTQYVAFMNAEKIPSGDDLKFNYTHLTITDKLKRERYLYRLALNKKKK